MLFLVGFIGIKIVDPEEGYQLITKIFIALITSTFVLSIFESHLSILAGGVSCLCFIPGVIKLYEKQRLSGEGKIFLILYFFLLCDLYILLLIESELIRVS